MLSATLHVQNCLYNRSQARKLEQVCVQRWREQGYTPPAHGLAGPLEAQAGRFLRTWI